MGARYFSHTKAEAVFIIAKGPKNDGLPRALIYRLGTMSSTSLTFLVAHLAPLNHDGPSIDLVHISVLQKTN